MAGVVYTLLQRRIGLPHGLGVLLIARWPASLAYAAGLGGASRSSSCCRPGCRVSNCCPLLAYRWLYYSALDRRDADVIGWNCVSRSPALRHRPGSACRAIGGPAQVQRSLSGFCPAGPAHSAFSRLGVRDRCAPYGGQHGLVDLLMLAGLVRWHRARLQAAPDVSRA